MQPDCPVGKPGRSRRKESQSNYRRWLHRAKERAGRDAFHRVPILPQEIRDGVESVPTVPWQAHFNFGFRISDFGFQSLTSAATLQPRKRSWNREIREIRQNRMGWGKCPVHQLDEHTFLLNSFSFRVFRGLKCRFQVQRPSRAIDGRWVWVKICFDCTFTPEIP